MNFFCRLFLPCRLFMDISLWITSIQCLVSLAAAVLWMWLCCEWKFSFKYEPILPVDFSLCSLSPWRNQPSYWTGWVKLSRVVQGTGEGTERCPVDIVLTWGRIGIPHWTVVKGQNWYPHSFLKGDHQTQLGKWPQCSISLYYFVTQQRWIATP